MCSRDLIRTRIALSNMNGDELKSNHDTFVLPYYALKEKE